MQFSTLTTILSLLLTTTTLTSALPQSTTTNTNSTYYGVSINANVADAFSPPIYEPIPVEINVLAVTSDLSCSELIFDSGVAANVNLSTVECRAYKDEAGVVPGSNPFTLASPADLSTNLVTVGSVLCYITEG